MRRYARAGLKAGWFVPTLLGNYLLIVYLNIIDGYIFMIDKLLQFIIYQNLKFLNFKHYDGQYFIINCS